MQKLIGKLFHKVTDISLCLVMLLNTIIPVTVLAADKYSYTLTFTISEAAKTTHSMDVDGGHLKIDSEYVDFSDDTNNNIGTVDCNSNKTTCTITVTDGPRGTLTYNSHEKFTLYASGKEYSFGTVFTTDTSILIEDYQEETPGGSEFDGSAYYVWKCGNNACYHKITGLTGMNPDGSGYETNYIKASSLTDESGNGVNYKWNTELANWVLAGAVEDSEGNVDSSKMTLNYVFGDGDKDMGIQLDPAGATSGENSICSNGDMNFRACITSDDYEAITFSTREEDYTYFPSFWDQTFHSSTVDISDTTKDDPAVYQAYLLEPEISFKSDEASASAIKSVKPLDVNTKAVNVEYIDGEYVVTFKSNYYDKVIFEITTEDGKKQYIRIDRMVLSVSDNFAPDVTDSKLIATLYYPTTKSYKDFEVVATIVKSDGSTETKVVEASKISMIDTSHPNINEYIGQGGTNLYRSEYSVDASKDIIGAYFTVVYNGALDEENYGGTFAGSGKGVYYDVETRSIIYE